MKETYKADCNCLKSRERNCTCGCSSECCCNSTSRCDSHRNRCHNRCHSCCRRDLCNKDFQINLAGLTDGLNYRLRQLLGHQVAIVLDNEVKIIGTIAFIGSNFIELLIEQNHAPTEDTDQTESETLDEPEKRDHKKGDSCIIPINKIMTVEFKCGSTPSENENLL